MHDRCAALRTLADVLGAGAAADVMKAMESDELKFRVPAARTGAALAAAIAKTHKPQAAALAKKVLTATQEQATLQQARAVLGSPG